MDIRELGRLDLNLLVALEALLEERNVSRAAERLYITQSAMSKTLGRLRELFDDPLFVRKSSGMIPTPRAEQLGLHLPQVLQAVQAMVQPPEFDPLTYEGRFKLLVQGHTGIWALPRLMERLRESAPGVHLRTVSQAEDPFDMLASGDLDFLLQPERLHYPPEVRVDTLGFAPPMLLARSGHPLEGEELTWEMVLAYPQVSLLLTEIAEIQFIAEADSAFLQHERAFAPHLETDNLFTAIQMVLRSDFLFPAPPLFLEQGELAAGLIALPLPEEEKVTLKYVLAQHERVCNSAPHRFLHGEMLAVIELFRRDYGLPSLAEMRASRNLEY
jgi:DNA-binding transcriptional LysR family regulator